MSEGFARRYGGLAAMMLHLILQGCTETSDRSYGAIREWSTLDPSSGTIELAKVREVPQITGVWRIFTSDLGTGAPPCALEKQFGSVVWRILPSEEGIILLESEPSSFDVPASDLEGLTYRRIRLEKVRIDTHKISFQIDREQGTVETFELRYFDEDEIEGTYRIYDPNGGAAGDAAEYLGTVKLIPLEH